VKRICPVCGKEFEDKSINLSKKTCSNKCRDALLYRDEEKKFARSVQMRLGVMKRSGGVEFDEETIEQIKKDLKIGRCMTCGRERREDEKDFHIDHDHVTGKYRGILCPQCNYALGNIGDNPFGALVLASYLIDHNAGGNNWKRDWLDATSIYLLTQDIVHKLEIDVDSIDILLGIETQWDIRNSELYQIVNS